MSNTVASLGSSGASGDSLEQRHTRQAHLLASLTIALIALYVILDVVAQLLPPHYNPISQAESDLAVGPYGYVMTINFVARGVLSLILLVALIRGLPARARSGVGMVLLGIWGVGALLLAIFPTDLAGARPTLHGALHLLIATIAFISVAIAELLLSLRFAHDTRWSAFEPLAVTLALATILAGVVLLLGPFAPHVIRAALSGYFGLIERVFLGLALLWMLLVAIRLRATGNEQTIKS